MMKSIVEVGEKNLRKVSKEVPTELISTPEIQDLIQDLSDTLINYKTRDGKPKGVGFAANQIGVNYRVFIIYIQKDPKKEEDPTAMPLTVFINPKIVSRKEAMVDGFEGCMSIPKIRCSIKRYKEITVEALNEKGISFSMHLSGFKARVFQHEYDHLDGIVYIDKADMQTITTEKQYVKKWRKAKPDDVALLRTHQY